MVFTTTVNLVRSRGPDEFWRKRKILKMAAHFVGRKRNCFSIAVRYVHRALAYITMGRILRKADMRNLWETRITAGCDQHNIDYKTFREALSRCDILLDRKSLANLAAWEPYTFKALTDIAKRRAIDDGLASFTKREEVDRIISRGVTTK